MSVPPDGLWFITTPTHSIFSTKNWSLPSSWAFAQQVDPLVLSQAISLGCGWGGSLWWACSIRDIGGPQGRIRFWGGDGQPPSAWTATATVTMPTVSSSSYKNLRISSSPVGTYLVGGVANTQAAGVQVIGTGNGAAISLWSASATARVCCVFRDNSPNVFISNKTTYIFTVGYYDNAINVWNGTFPFFWSHLTSVLPAAYPTLTAMSANQYVSYVSGTACILWNISDTVIAKWQMFTIATGVSYCAVSPDGSSVLLIANGIVQLFSVLTPAPILSGSFSPTYDVKSIAWHPSGEYFFVGSSGYILLASSLAHCPQGYVCNSTSKIGAVQICDAGYFCPPATSRQIPCPAGSYSSAGASYCALCLAGSYSATGATTCSPCPPGSFSPFNGSTSCQQCNVGAYCPGSGALNVSCNPSSACPVKGISAISGQLWSTGVDALGLPTSGVEVHWKTAPGGGSSFMSPGPYAFPSIYAASPWYRIIIDSTAQ